MTLPGTNETLREALQDVNTPNLLLVLATITGDDLWLSERYAPADRGAGGKPVSG